MLILGLSIGEKLGAVAIDSQVRFERVSMEHGLSQSSVQAMAQCSEGYLWFGTQYGLDRFDGYTFKRVQTAATGRTVHGFVRLIEAAPSGRVWVSAQDGLFLLKDMRLHEVWPGRDRDVPDHILAIAESDQGIFFAVTSLSLLRVADSSGHVDVLPLPEPLRGRRIDDAELARDGLGRIWLEAAGGLWRLRSDALLYDEVVSPSISVEATSALTVDAAGRPLFAQGSSLRWFEPSSGEVEQLIELDSDRGPAVGSVQSLHVAPDGALWLLTENALFRMDVAAGSIQTILRDSDSNSWSGKVQSALSVGEAADQHWVAGSFGAGIYHPDTGEFRLFLHDPSDPGSIGPTIKGNGYRVLQDSEGGIWLAGGLGGLSRYAPVSNRFQHIRSVDEERGGAGHNIVRALAEQRIENDTFLWVSEDGAGLVQFKLDEGGEFRLLRRLGRKEGLAHENVWNLAVDPVDKAVWGANQGHLIRIDPASGKVHVLADPAAEGRRFNALEFARDGRSLWVGASGRLLRIWLAEDRSSASAVDNFDLIPVAELGHSGGVHSLHEASDGRILVATQYGLVVLDPRDRSFTRLLPFPESLRDGRNWLFSVTEMPTGTVWIGGRLGGLGKIALEDLDRDDAASRVQWYSREQGLADDTVYAILPEPDSGLWLSSNRGLSFFDPSSGRVRQFGPRDGVQHYEFNNTVAHIGDSGRYYFGGINGTNAFRPEDIVISPDPPRLHLDRVIAGGETLPLSSQRPKPIQLSHRGNELSIAYVGLHYSDPARNHYAYRLEGADSDWVDAGTQRDVRYRSLAPGQYRFWLRAANSDGVWSEPALMLEASVAPPPWRSPGAFLVYALAVAALVWLWLQAQSRRRRALEALVAQRTRELSEQSDLVATQARALEDALNARTILFANVSHEFRTPLTLIQASIDRLDRAGADPEAIALGRRYLHRLLRLVEQLLDLSRLRMTDVKPETEPWSLSSKVASISEAFHSLAEQSGITLSARVEQGWTTLCSGDQVELIVQNLIGNALKFTPSGGQVEVLLRGDQDHVELTVADTGPGIAEADQALIFERFHRTLAAERHSAHGAGLGLALVREAVQAIGGRVWLDSRVGQGSRFTVSLPAARGDVQPRYVDAHVKEFESDHLDLHPAATRGVDVEARAGQGNGRLGTLLVVEDSHDLRAYLLDILGDEWRVLSAEDGRQGLAMACAASPDLVVSDIMMPVMDGLEFLAALREDIRTSHLPVLLLTARQDHATRLAGLTLAADNFLSKPFDAQELRLRLRSMLQNRKRLQNRLRRELGAAHAQAFTERPETSAHPLSSTVSVPDEVRWNGAMAAGTLILSSRDQRMLDQLDSWLGEHFGESDIDVEAMAVAVSMDVRTLQRKLKALLDQNPGGYLREFRLAQARRLLRDGDRPITDIALSCGFSSVQYFSRVFRKEHGQSPDAWRRAASPDSNNT